MGWASGGELADQMIKIISKHVPDDKVRRKIYKKMINAFEEMDCDTLMECKGIDPTFDYVFDKMYPPDPEEFDEHYDD